MRPFRLPTRRAGLTLVAASILLLTLAGPGAAGAGDLPPAVARLLPADAQVLLVFSSLDAADQAWNALAHPDGAPAADAPSTDPDGTAPAPRPRTPHDLLASLAPGLEDLVDPARPLAIALSIPAPMTQGGRAPVVALPLRDRKLDARKVKEKAGGALVFVQDGYAAVTRDSSYTPGAAGPALAIGLPDAALAARVDLASVIAMYRPLVEMMLPILSQPGAFAAGDSGQAKIPAVTPAQVQMIQGFLGGFFDSARRLDLALDSREGSSRLGLTFAVAPGSPLDPGPQPDFASALALARYLPAGFSVYQASATDASRTMAFLGPLQHESMVAQAQTLPAAVRDGYVQWMDDCLALTSTPMPCASAMAATGGSLRSRMIVSAADPEALVARVVALYGRLDALKLGLDFNEGPAATVDGVPVRTFTMGVDAQEMARLVTKPADGAATSDAAADSAALIPIRQMARMMHAFCPAIHVATLPGLVVTCVDSDPAAMADLLAQVRGGGGEVPPVLQAAAAGGGPGTQLVTCGDLGALFRAMLVATEPALADVRETTPVSFAMTGGLRGSEMDLAITGDPRGLTGLFGTLQAFAKAQANGAGMPADEATTDDTTDDAEGE